MVRLPDVDLIVVALVPRRGRAADAVVEHGEVVAVPVLAVSPGAVRHDIRRVLPCPVGIVKLSDLSDGPVNLPIDDAGVLADDQRGEVVDSVPAEDVPGDPVVREVAFGACVQVNGELGAGFGLLFAGFGTDLAHRVLALGLHVGRQIGNLSPLGARVQFAAGCLLLRFGSAAGGRDLNRSRAVAGTRLGHRARRRSRAGRGGKRPGRRVGSRAWHRDRRTGHGDDGQQGSRESSGRPTNLIDHSTSSGETCPLRGGHISDARQRTPELPQVRLFVPEGTHVRPRKPLAGRVSRRHRDHSHSDSGPRLTLATAVGLFAHSTVMPSCALLDVERFTRSCDERVHTAPTVRSTRLTFLCWLGVGWADTGCDDLWIAARHG